MKNNWFRVVIFAVMITAVASGWLRYRQNWVVEHFVAGAAARGWWPVMWPLLALGMSPDARYDDRPLMVLIFDDGKGPTHEVARALLAFGADVNARAPGDWTALMVAADWGDIDGIAFLLSHGADPNIESVDGRTTLLHLHASPNGTRDLSIVRSLVTAGADPCHKDHAGNSAANALGGAKTLAGAFLLDACQNIPARCLPEIESSTCQRHG